MENLMKKQAEDRTTVTLSSEAHRVLRRLADDNGWSVATAAQTAIEALEVLLDLHSQTAAKAAEPDVRELFMELARLMPAGLVEGRQTEWGRISDGGAALIVDGWVFARDTNGEMMAVRQDAGQVGHIDRGRVQPLADTIVVDEIAALN
jgi:hypothetical protein